MKAEHIEREETEKKIVTPHSFYDTIELPYPFPSGWAGEFFRDLYNKNSDATNFRQQRRLPHGSTFQLSAVRVAAIHWSGDVVWDRITDAATLEVRVNNRVIAEMNLTERRHYEFLRTDVKVDDASGKEVKTTYPKPVTITDRDDLSAQIKLTCSPAFSVPQVHEVGATAVKKRVERKFLKFLPWLVQNTEVHEPVWISRPLKGTCLLKLTLVGELER